VIAWGDPAPADARRLTGTMELVVRRPELHPPAVLYDFRAVTHVAAEVFEVMFRHTTWAQRLLAGRTIREAILPPSGLAGSIVAGMHHVVDQAWERAVFAELGPALRWLGHARLAPAYRRLERMQGQALASSGLAASVAAEVARDLAQPVAQVARALGVSPRTLQRRLGAAGSSFRAIVTRVRLDRAKELLARQRLKQAEIAAAVGCGSESRFSSWFKGQCGVTPSQWRKRLQS
jgi:AraC-like DNA-binding protein